MTNRRAWTASIFCSVGVLGAFLQLRGALIPSFAGSFAVSEGELGLIASAASAGTLVSVSAVGTAVGRIDVGRALVLAGVAFVALLVALAFAPTYAVLLAGFGAAGLAQGSLHALDRPLLSHLYPDRRGRIYNLQDMAWAVGATLGPLLATAALVVANWRLAFLVLACAFVPVVAAFRRLEAPGFETEEALAPRELASLLRTPTVGTMAPLMLLLSLVEGGIFTWLPYYVGESLPRGVANLSLSLYLAAYVPGRYAFSRATDRVDELALVVATAALATAALVGFLSTSGYAMLAAVAVVGFLVAGMFPTLLAWATDHAPEYSGPVNALAFIASGIGFAVFPALMGGVAGRYTIEAAMALLAVAMAAFALVAAAAVVRGS